MLFTGESIINHKEVERMAVIIGGFKQETNSFSARTMTVDDYLDYAVDEDIMTKYKGKRGMESGAIDILEKEGYEIVPTVSAFGGSGGLMEGKSHQLFHNGIIDRIKSYMEYGTIDAVIMCMHGAAVAEDSDDPEGDLAEAIRAIVGPDVPIGFGFDGHAFISQKMMDNADIIVGYQTFPHHDEYETGQRVTDLTIRLAKGEIKPVMSVVDLPCLLPPHAELDYQEPMKGFMDMCREAEKLDGVLSVSLFPVQPWMDIEGLMGHVIVTTNDKGDLGDAEALKIAKAAWEVKDQFEVVVVEPHEAVKHAMSLESGTVALSEVADAPPAGAAGDSNELLKALIDEKPDKPCYLVIFDPKAVKQAEAAGEGSHAKLTVGYSLDPRWGEPIEIEGDITRIFDGSFITQFNGSRLPMGRTAEVQIGQITLLLCEKVFPHFDPNCYTGVGLDISKARILGVKSTQHFRHYYADVCSEIHLLDGWGPSSSDFKRFDWKHLDRSTMWPLSDMADYQFKAYRK